MNSNSRKNRGQYHYRHSPSPRDPDIDASLTSLLQGVYLNPHILHSLTALIGCVVHVDVGSGIVYEGILRAISPHLDIALELAYVKSKPFTKENVEKLIELKFADVVKISAKGEANSLVAMKDNIFKTDTEISRSNGINTERELERFTDFVEEDEQCLDLTDSGLESRGWSVDEMFSVNKEKFQVASSYDEEMTQYTTKLDRSETDEFKQREVRAAKLASEIETKDKSDTVDDVGTEEEMFSAVVRQEVSSAPSSNHQPKQDEQLDSVCNVTSVPDSYVIPNCGRNEHEVKPVNGIEVDISTSPGSIAKSAGDSEPEQVSGESLTEKASVNETQNATPEVKDDENKDLKPNDANPIQSTDEGQVENATQEHLPETQAGVDKKEESIRKFKLDPTAKEFSPIKFDSPPSVVTGSTTRTSPSPTVTSTPVSHTPSYHTTGSGRKSNRPHRHKSHMPLYSQDQQQVALVSSASASSGGYVISAQPSPVIPGLVRPMQQVPHMAGQVLYTGVPQFGAYIASQPGIVNPQIVTAPKFDVSPQHQVIGQHSHLTQQAQILAHQGQHHVLSASSPQIMAAPQGLFTSPHHHAQMISTMQEGLGSTASVAAGPHVAMQNAGLLPAGQHQIGQTYTPGTGCCSWYDRPVCVCVQ